MKKNIPFFACIFFTCFVFFLKSGAGPLSKKIYITDTTMKDNSLTAVEKKEGWQLLFNGKSTKNWRTYKNEPANTWLVENGVLVCKKDTSHNAQYADLISEQQFANFELSIDWKIAPQANSGIMYHVTEEYDKPYKSGPEYQLIDNKGYPGKIEEYQKTAANYAMDAPLVDATNPVGEWNHTVIIVNNAHVEHWLNGKKVVEYELWSDEWKQHKAEGKWKDEPGYGASKMGYIALQGDHGGGLWFKNIKIKILP